MLKEIKFAGISVAGIANSCLRYDLDLCSLSANAWLPWFQRLFARRKKR
jgi:hypothetical protein